MPYPAMLTYVCLLGPNTFLNIFLKIYNIPMSFPQKIGHASYTWNVIMRPKPK
jgi:hypothetical protein